MNAAEVINYSLLLNYGYECDMLLFSLVDTVSSSQLVNWFKVYIKYSKCAGCNGKFYYMLHVLKCPKILNNGQINPAILQFYTNVVGVLFKHIQ